MKRQTTEEHKAMAEMGENTLQIFGEAAELHRFRERADENLVPAAERDPYNSASPSLLSFHRLFPVPADVAAQDYGAKGGGYEWQKSHWGVKWGATQVYLDVEPAALTYSFETAWYPPLPFLKTVSADYPTLTFLLDFTSPSRFQEQFAFQQGRAIEVDEVNV